MKVREADAARKRIKRNHKRAQKKCNEVINSFNIHLICKKELIDEKQRQREINISDLDICTKATSNNIDKILPFQVTQPEKKLHICNKNVNSTLNYEHDYDIRSNKNVKVHEYERPVEKRHLNK